MTPKEKANELLEKMYANQGWDPMVEDSEEVKERAKKCVLIAVDEMLGMLPFPNDEWHEERKSYLEEVKQEIINI